MGIAWQDTGLDHHPRRVLDTPGRPIEHCLNHPDTPVCAEYAHAGLCQDCGDNTSHAIEQEIQRRGWEDGLDIRTEPYVRWGWV